MHIAGLGAHSAMRAATGLAEPAGHSIQPLGAERQQTLRALKVLELLSLKVFTTAAGNATFETRDENHRLQEVDNSSATATAKVLHLHRSPLASKPPTLLPSRPSSTHTACSPVPSSSSGENPRPAFPRHRKETMYHGSGDLHLVVAQKHSSVRRFPWQTTHRYWFVIGSTNHHLSWRTTTSRGGGPPG